MLVRDLLLWQRHEMKTSANTEFKKKKIRNESTLFNRTPLSIALNLVTAELQYVQNPLLSRIDFVHMKSFNKASEEDFTYQLYYLVRHTVYSLPFIVTIHNG